MCGFCLAVDDDDTSDYFLVACYSLFAVLIFICLDWPPPKKNRAKNIIESH